MSRNLPRYFYFNTNDGFTKRLNPDIWFRNGLAISDGDPEFYGEPLRLLRPRDILFMYKSKVGILGIGEVKEAWDGIHHYTKKLTQNFVGCAEFRIPVDWFVDCRESPISGTAAIGHTVPKFLQEIKSHHDRAQKLVDSLFSQQVFTASPRAGKEGRPRLTITTVYERDPGLRAESIRFFGCRCQVCHFDFKKVFGTIGRDFIEVHHIVPLAESKGSRDVDPTKDLIPICPNCHAMIHQKIPPYTVSELQKIRRVQKQRTKR